MTPSPKPSVAGAGALNTASKAANAAIGRSGPTVAAFDRAGVTPTIAGGAAGGTTGGRVTSAVAGMPGGTGTVAASARNTADEFAAAVDRVATTLGPSPTPQRAGEGLQQAADAWLGQWRQQSTDAWDAVWNQLAPNISSRLPVTRGLLANSETALRREAPGVAGSLESDFMRDLAAEVGPLRNLSAQALRQLRTRIGERLDRSALVGGEDQAALKRLYGALTDDMESLVLASGRPAMDAFREANRITREGHELLNGTVRNLLGTPNAPRAPEEAYRWFAGQTGLGDTRLGNVRQAVGDAAFNDAAGARLRELARPGAASS